MARQSMILCVLLLCFSTVAINGDEAEDKAVCMKMSKKLLKKCMKLFSTCTSELASANPNEFSEKMGCAVKCVMKKLEVLDTDDNISENVIKDHIESHLPASKVEHAHEALKKCISLHDELDPKDPNCVKYLKLGHCMQNALTDLCGEMPLI